MLEAWDAVRRSPVKELWIEGNRFIKKIIDREQCDPRSEYVTLECGHRFRVAITTSTSYRCRFCVREKHSGIDPPDDPTPVPQNH